MNKKPWWMCPLEWEKLNSPDWKMVHNGQQNPIQFEFPPDEVRYFTHKIECIRGMWTGLVLTFKYDLRKRRGDICSIEWREPCKEVV